VNWGWAGLAAAAAILLFVLVPPAGDPGLADLAQVEPLPVRITRAVPEPDSFEDHRLRGLEAYATGDYLAAGAHLADALELRPADAEILLYLGSTFLLRGQPESAADLLGGPAIAATDPVLRDEAAWQLANALLMAGRVEEAEQTLETLAVREGRRRGDAQALVEALRSHP
jgi:thioredoxin-like negative regulator of GroEL